MSSPASIPLTEAEPHDLDKFIKYLAIKTVQVVVQSRLGEKVRVASQPVAKGSASWFTLVIRDIPEVLSETKRAMNSRIPAPGLPLVVEISLKTAEGDTMVLEWWRLSIIAGGDHNVPMAHNVYNRMGMMLKALITTSRSIPAYKLSRRQGADSFVICYRIFLGEPPDPPYLGDGALTAKVGQLTTPHCTVVCCVDYRTNMTISPTPSSQRNLLRSDQYETREDIYHRFQKREHRVSESDLTMTSDDSQEIRLFATSPPDRLNRKSLEEEALDKFKFGAFARTESLRSLPCLEEEEAIEPLLNLLPRNRQSSTISVTSGETSAATTDSHTDTQFLMSSDSGNAGDRFSGAASTVTTAALAATATSHQAAGAAANTAAIGIGATGAASTGTTATSHIGKGTAKGARRNLTDLLGTGGESSAKVEGVKSAMMGGIELDREFVMIEMKTPFAQPSSIAGDGGGGGAGSSDISLGSFFKEVSKAPTLTSLPPAAPLSECLDSLSSQIAGFESHLGEYDDFLNQMGSASEQEDNA